MKYQNKNGARIEVMELDRAEQVPVEPKESTLYLLWLQGEGNRLSVDGEDYDLSGNTIMTFTEFHQVRLLRIRQAKLLTFNRDFYCIMDHDEEVGCKGLLFFGAHMLPIIKCEKNNFERLQDFWVQLEKELGIKAPFQLEILQATLKSILIYCARKFKSQYQAAPLGHHHLDLVREYNYLVEKHFRTVHTVKEYAQLLNKSPKTLSNYFKVYGRKPPLEYIQERRIAEAKRLLLKTDRQVSEIAFEIGFSDVQSFSRFFKKHEHLSPTAYKNSLKGNPDNDQGTTA